jgi:hypothetical protein
MYPGFIGVIPRHHEIQFGRSIDQDSSEGSLSQYSRISLHYGKYVRHTPLGFHPQVVIPSSLSSAMAGDCASRDFGVPIASLGLRATAGKRTVYAQGTVTIGDSQTKPE